MLNEFKYWLSGDNGFWKRAIQYCPFRYCFDLPPQGGIGGETFSVFGRQAASARASPHMQLLGNPIQSHGRFFLNHGGKQPFAPISITGLPQRCQIGAKVFERRPYECERPFLCVVVELRPLVAISLLDPSGPLGEHLEQLFAEALRTEAPSPSQTYTANWGLPSPPEKLCQPGGDCASPRVAPASQRTPFVRWPYRRIRRPASLLPFPTTAAACTLAQD
jgi:hypothetical protein